jgi:hypothetical protein
LAVTFMRIEPWAGWSLGTSGKSRRKNGRVIAARILMAPPCSPTFMMPSHSVSAPVRPSAISKAVLDMSKVLVTRAVKIAVSPRKISLISAMTSATRKKPTQM